MSENKQLQCCAMCAWRENCAKKFCVPDGGAHCPDFTRDISIKSNDRQGDGSQSDRQEK